MAVREKKSGSTPSSTSHQPDGHRKGRDREWSGDDDVMRRRQQTDRDRHPLRGRGDLVETKEERVRVDRGHRDLPTDGGIAAQAGQVEDVAGFPIRTVVDVGIAPGIVGLLLAWADAVAASGRTSVDERDASCRASPKSSKYFESWRM